MANAFAPWRLVAPALSVLLSGGSAATLSRLREAGLPVFVLHGERDQVVPVAAARDAGDAAAAREIAKLRKPTIAAWLVNLLALRRPELVAELAELSTALRSAQRELRGEQLRKLSGQRRAAVAALVAQARELATAEDPGVDPSRLPLAEVESTLTAALADADVAALVRTGRLVRAVAYAGFGEVPRPQLRLVTGGAAAPAAGPAGAEAEPPAPDRAAIRREVAAARTAQKQADAALERAARAEADGAAALERLDAELAELERRRAAAEEELGRRKLARKSAERAAVAARQRFGEAQAALEAIEDDAKRR